MAKDCPDMPSEVMKKLYFDSITHDEDMLKVLIQRAGADHVMMGSDYPFPLGEVPSVAPGTGEVLNCYPGKPKYRSKASLRLRLNGLLLYLLYTGDVLFHVECCIRQLCSPSLISYNITSIS